MKRSCKTSLGTSFIDFMYKRSLETLVLPFFYIETFAAALVVAFWIVRALIDLVGGGTYCAYYIIRISACNEHAQSEIETAPTSVTLHSRAKALCN